MKKATTILLAVMGIFLIQAQLWSDTNIFDTVKAGSLNDLKAYLKKGGDANARDENGMTLLMWAAMRDADFVKLLLDAKANVNENNGLTALILAAVSEKVDSVKLLLAAGADVNARNKQGYTALMVAAATGNVEIARMLIAAKADTGIKDNEGKTALQWAAEQGKTEIVKLLTAPASGSDSNKRFTAGKWAFTVISALNEGAEIVNTLGTWKYTYRAADKNHILVRIVIGLEQLEGKPIKDSFLSIDARIKDSAGNLYPLFAAGCENEDYYVFSKGGSQSLMLPVQAKANMDFVFSVPAGAVITEFIWPGSAPARVDVGIKLTGTTWEFSLGDTITFLDGGVVSFNKLKSNGKWKQSGNKVVFDCNNFTGYDVAIINDTLDGVWYRIASPKETHPAFLMRLRSTETGKSNIKFPGTVWQVGTSADYTVIFYDNGLAVFPKDSVTGAWIQIGNRMAIDINYSVMYDFTLGNNPKTIEGTWYYGSSPKERYSIKLQLLNNKGMSPKSPSIAGTTWTWQNGTSAQFLKDGTAVFSHTKTVGHWQQKGDVVQFDFTVNNNNVSYTMFIFGDVMKGVFYLAKDPGSLYHADLTKSK